jgi:hypothetical protein
MWHIGVRDEAKRLDGIGRCARQFCSAAWLPELRPVKSSVAKDQRLSTLNPSQISGSCGRLMCCLRYEHEFYVKQRKRFPKEGKIVVTLAGEEKIVANDIFREQVTLRGATGETRIVPLAQLNRELGGEPATAASDLASSEDDLDFEEETTTEMYLVDPPRSADTRTYPGAVKESDDRRPKTEDRKPRTERPRPPQQQREQQRPPQRPQQQPQKAQPQAEQPSQPGDANAEGGRRRRRRGRRGGRRGREGGGPQNGQGGAPNGPTSPPPASPSGS